MDAQNAWQAFVKTGNILTYLDYRQQEVPGGSSKMPAQEDNGYGLSSNNGVGTPGNQI
jgi:hypothetical protein